MPKKELAKTTVKKEPVKTALKKEPVKAALKKEPVKTAVKKEPVKAALKKEPVKTALKKEPVKAALKKEPVKTALKKEPVKTASKNADMKISQFEKQYMLVLEELTQVTKKHETNAAPDTLSDDLNEVSVIKTDARLLTALTNAGVFFFKKPTYDTLHHFKRICKREFAVAEHEYKKHRGIWRQINPIVIGLQNIFAGLSAVPILIDAATSKLGRLKPSYQGKKTAKKKK